MDNLQRPDAWDRGLKYLFFATLIIATELAVYSLRWILLLAFAGIAFGVLLAPIVRLAERRLKVSKAWAGLLIASFVLLATLLIVFFIFELLSDQMSSLTHRAPAILEALRLKAELLQERSFWFRTIVSSVDFSAALSKTGVHLLQSVRIGATAVAACLVFIFIAIYTSVAPGYYLEGFLTFLPPARRNGFRTALLAVAANLRRWFQAQLIAIVTVGLAISFGLWLLGLDYWLLFGVLSGLLDIVPYIGSFVPAIGALLVAMATSPEKSIWVIFIFILVHQFENNVLVPLVMKYRMRFPPVLLMLLMLTMATWFGTAGIFVTAPLFTALRTLYLEAYLRG